MKKSERPKIKLELRPADKILEGLALLALAALVLLPIIYWGDLPEKIPIHFNARGEADGYGQPVFLWAVTAVGVFIYALMTVVNKNPHNFNYMKNITAENAEQSYRSATQMIRWLKAVILILFAYTSWMMIQNALGKTSGLGSWFLPLVLLTIVAPTFYFIFKMGSKK